MISRCYLSPCFRHPPLKKWSPDLKNFRFPSTLAPPGDDGAARWRARLSLHHFLKNIQAPDREVEIPSGGYLSIWETDPGRFDPKIQWPPYINYFQVRYWKVAPIFPKMLRNLVLFACFLGISFAQVADPTAQLNGATITGVNEDSVSKFLGIPYAEPP